MKLTSSIVMLTLATSLVACKKDKKASAPAPTSSPTAEKTNPKKPATPTTGSKVSKSIKDLGHYDSDVRRDAAVELGKLGVANAKVKTGMTAYVVQEFILDSLKSAKKDESEEVRKAAQDSLDKIEMGRVYENMASRFFYRNKSKPLLGSEIAKGCANQVNSIHIRHQDNEERMTAFVEMKDSSGLILELEGEASVIFDFFERAEAVKGPVSKLSESQYKQLEEFIQEKSFMAKEMNKEETVVTFIQTEILDRVISIDDLTLIKPAPRKLEVTNGKATFDPKTPALIQPGIKLKNGKAVLEDRKMKRTDLDKKLDTVNALFNFMKKNPIKEEKKEEESKK